MSTGPSGVPLLLELIALYVDGNPNATFAPATNDPIGPLLEAVCERENVRQKLNISSEKQMMVFEELFRDFLDDIPRSELGLYVQVNVPNVTADALERFESHAFFSPGKDVRARFETLRVYFVARWLANRLESAATDEQVPKTLERHASGDTDVFDFLVDRFLSLGEETIRAAIPHALTIMQARSHWEGLTSALFHLAQRLAHRTSRTKEDRTSALQRYLGIGSTVRRVCVIGQISGLDLSRLQFESCVFKELVFRNCVFGDKTKFTSSRFE
jgi:hypothetical protein